MERYVNPTQGETISFEPWNFDSGGLALAPGQRCRVTIGSPDGSSVVFEFDRHLAERLIAFLDKQVE